MNERQGFSVAAIVAERPDMQPTGEAYLELATTGAVVASIPPYGRRQVAAFLRAVLDRAPVDAGEAYAAHRAILGALRYELETAAIAGALSEPTDERVDLRDPGTRDRERALISATREWAASEQQRRGEAYHARIDAILEEPALAHATAQERLDAAVARAQDALAAPAAPESDDASAWLA